MMEAMLQKNKCFAEIDRTLGQYENLKFLKDMKVSWREYMDDGDQRHVSEEFFCDLKRHRGLKVLRELIALYVAEDFVEGTLNYVVEQYDLEWQRYLRDKEAGFVKVHTEDYRNYSWRGNGPKPYFEGLILKYIKKKKYRSIDD